MNHNQLVHPRLGKRAFAVCLVVTLLAACSSKPPGCADEQTVNLAKTIVLETWKKSMPWQVMDVTTPEVAQYNDGLKVEIRNIASDGYNADARKYSCTGSFVVTTMNSMAFTVQQNFTSQATADGNGKFVVQIADMDSLVQSLKADLFRFIGTLNGKRDQAEEKKKEEARQGHSFNCSEARNTVERSICSDPVLAELDVAMVSAYNVVLSKAVDKPGVRTAQATWRDMVRDSCPSVQCLTEAYQKRVEKLNRGDWAWR